MASLYITSVAPGSGKTAVAAGLVTLLTSRGKRAAYVKPISTASTDAKEPPADPDLAFCRAACPTGIGEPMYVAPAGLQGGLGKLKAAARDWLTRAAAGAGTLVIEGLATAGDTATASADLAEAAAASVIGVVRVRRFVDLAGVKALPDIFGSRLLGVVLNAVPAQAWRAAHEEIAPELRQAGIPVLGIIPEERMLLGFTVNEYSARLGGRVINSDAHATRVVENLLVGANILDQGDLYYERVRNKALITRGSRPDLQFSALTNATRCLILTGGVDPIPYVLDKAIEENVPIVVVPKGTMETVSAIEGFIAAPTFFHPDKLARYAALLDTHMVKGPIGL